MVLNTLKNLKTNDFNFKSAETITNNFFLTGNQLLAETYIYVVMILPITWRAKNIVIKYKIQVLYVKIIYTETIIITILTLYYVTRGNHLYKKKNNTNFYY